MNGVRTNLSGRGIYAASSHGLQERLENPQARRCFTVKRPKGRAPLTGWLLAMLVGVLFALCTFSAHAEISAADFELANRLYAQGKFQEAASAYEKLLQSGQTSAALCFNLGNAFFKSGQIGRALAAYRAGEQFAPRDPDLRANLQFARNQVQGPSLAPDWWQRWLGRLSLNEWTWLAVVAFWLLLVALTLSQLRPAWKAMLKTYLLPLGVATVVLCICLAAALYSSRCTPTAIVIAPEATVHLSPLEESPTAFTAHDGAELRVLDQKDDWLQVSTDPRHLGWLKRDQVLLTPKPQSNRS